MMPNNQILGACSGADKKIKLFDLSPILLQNCKPIEIYTQQTEHTDRIKSLCFSEDNQLCCCVSNDASLSLFTVELSSNNKLKQILHYQNLHSSCISKVQFLQSNNQSEQHYQPNQQIQKQQELNYLLVTVSWDKSMKILSFKAPINSYYQGTLTVLQSFENHHSKSIYNLKISKCLVEQSSDDDIQNYLVVTASGDSSIKLNYLSLNLSKSFIASKIIKQFSTTNCVYGVDMSKDGRFIICGDQANTVRVFENLEHI